MANSGDSSGVIFQSWLLYAGIQPRVSLILTFNWLVVWLPFFIFPYIGLLIIPIDVHIFQRGGPTTNQHILLASSHDPPHHLTIGGVPLLCHHPKIQRLRARCRGAGPKGCTADVYRPEPLVVATGGTGWLAAISEIFAQW